MSNPDNVTKYVIMVHVDWFNGMFKSFEIEGKAIFMIDESKVAMKDITPMAINIKIWSIVCINIFFFYIYKHIFNPFYIIF